MPFASILPLLNGRLEAFINFRRQQVLQPAPIPGGISRNDHLVGGAGAGEEMLRIKGAVPGHDGVEAGGKRRIRQRDALPAIHRLTVFRRLLQFRAAGRQRDDFIVGGATHRVARRVRIIRWPLASGPLSKHAPQSQENENRERQEYDGVDIEHVSEALGSRADQFRAERRSPNRGTEGLFREVM